MAPTGVYIVEVRRERVSTDPSIVVYCTTLETDRGIEKVTHPTLELLKSYLLGIQTVLRAAGYHGMLLWDYGPHQVEPTMVRWTLRQGELADIKYFDAAGNQIESMP